MRSRNIFRKGVRVSQGDQLRRNKLFYLVDYSILNFIDYIFYFNFSCPLYFYHCLFQAISI